MYEIYPTEESRKALTVFKVRPDFIEYFDLSKHPIERFSYTEKSEMIYSVNKDKCIGCKVCFSSCPQGAINFISGNAEIEKEHCLRCGECMKVCPEGAIVYGSER